MEEPSKSVHLYRAMIILTCLFACSAAVQYLEALFDRGDVRKALAVIEDFRGPDGRSIEAHLRERHGDQLASEPVWNIEIRSSCYGVMRATATVPLKQHAPTVYRFDVDLVRGSIHPADDAGRKILADMRNKPSPPAVPVGDDSGKKP